MARPDGTFLAKWEQLNTTVPLEYHSGNGSFAGYWVTLAAETVFQYETAVIWSTYACETGHPLGKYLPPASQSVLSLSMLGMLMLKRVSRFRQVPRGRTEERHRHLAGTRQDPGDKRAVTLDPVILSTRRIWLM